jgi:hypothetical protein
VGIHLAPPDNAPVLAVDETPQVQAQDRTQPTWPTASTTPAKTTHDYVPHGTTSLFLVLDITSGSVVAQHYRRHRHQEFLRCLELVDPAVAHRLPLALDTNATHKTGPFRKWLPRHPRFHLYFTLTAASWLTLVERRLAELTCHALRRSAHRSVERDSRGRINGWNRNPKPFVRTTTADDTIATLAAYST